MANATASTWRIIHVNSQLFVQGSWDTKHEAGRAKVKLSLTDDDFLGDNDYRIIPVQEIVNTMLNPS